MKKGLLFLLLSYSCFGQSEYEIYKEKYPNNNGVFLKRNHEVFVSIGSDGEPEIEIDVDEERLFLNENYKYYLEGSIGYSSFGAIEELKPIVYVPKGEKYKMIKIKDFTVESDIDQNVFYDDYKNMKFLYTGLEEGGKTSLTYKKLMHEPRFFGSFFFSSYLPVEKSTYTVHVPASMEITYRLYGDDKDKIKQTVTTKGNVKTYVFEMNDVKDVPFESGTVEFGYFATHIQLYINSYEYQGEKKNLIRNPEDLYAYYRGFVNDINKDEAPELIAIADSLTSGLETNEDKVKAILYWVQDNIKYIAFEDGLGGFIPREAALVCDRKYGDCKDMSSVLYYMINSVGIPAYYTWIGTRSIPYTYEEVPTPATDNHMICSYHDGEKYVFLDGTGKGQTYGMPTGFIQGKQALIGIDENNFVLEYVPIIDAEDNATVDTVRIEIDGEVVYGSGKVEYFGYASDDLIDYLKNMSKSDKKDFYDRYYTKGNNKSETEIISESGVNDREQNLSVEYTFKIEDYISTYEDELYFNPFLEKYFSNAKINTELNKLPKDRRTKDQTRNVLYVEVPDGYEVNSVPSNLDFSAETFSAKIETSIEDNVIKIVTVITTDHLVLYPEEFDAWNDMVKQLNNIYNQVIVFKKK